MSELRAMFDRRNFIIVLVERLKNSASSELVDGLRNGKIAAES
jgi:hypothetical protein